MSDDRIIKDESDYCTNWRCLAGIKQERLITEESLAGCECFVMKEFEDSITKEKRTLEEISKLCQREFNMVR